MEIKLGFCFENIRIMKNDTLTYTFIPYMQIKYIIQGYTNDTVSFKFQKIYNFFCYSIVQIYTKYLKLL